MMAKIILKGPKSCQWDLGNGFRGGGVPHDLTTNELKKAKTDDLIETYLEGEPVKQKIKICTEKELYKMNRDPQLKLIKKLGIEPTKKNNNLKLEEDRVNAILEVQK